MKTEKEIKQIKQEILALLKPYKIIKHNMDLPRQPYIRILMEHFRIHIFIHRHFIWHILYPNKGFPNHWNEHGTRRQILETTFGRGFASLKEEIHSILGEGK